MEPFSTLVLVAAFLAPVPPTKRPDWGIVDPRVSNHLMDVDSTTTNELVAAPTVVTESILMTPAYGSVSDRRVLLSQEVQAYKSLRDGWDGAGSVSVFPSSMESALYFVNQLPGGIPLPGPMVSFSGEIGFYWDFDEGYADMNFSSEGVGSFFSRNDSGEEHYQDSLNKESFTRDWFFGVLGALTAPKTRAA